MMGSVSRPNGARATAQVGRQATQVVDWRLSEIASRMGVCIVRTGGRLSTCADACTIKPRLDVAALPEALAVAVSLALSFVISAFGVLRPIQRKAVAYKPFTEIGPCNRAGRDRAAIRVEADWNTIDRTARNEAIKVIRGLRTATIL
jgi:hypothetical protein